jgi:hypothetical protein
VLFLIKARAAISPHFQHADNKSITKLTYLEPIRNSMQKPIEGETQPKLVLPKFLKQKPHINGQDDLMKKIVCVPAFCSLLVLVEKKAVDTWFHKHTAAVSTWSHADCVEKNVFLTPKQQPKNKQNTKQNPVLKQSCGSRKTAAST